MASKATKDPRELEEDEHLSDVYDALVEIKHRWYFIGLSLGVEPSKLDMIREQYGQRIDEALVEMLKHWLRQVRKPRTWEALIKALKKPSESSYGGGRIAREIEVRYNIFLDVTDQPQQCSEQIKNVDSMHRSCELDVSTINNETAPKLIARKETVIGLSTELHSQSENQHQEAKSTCRSLDSAVHIQFGKGSSTADQDQSSDYPFLDVNTLSEDDQEGLKGRLTKEYKEITAKFARFMEQLRLSLSHRGITPRQLYMVLMDLYAFALTKKDADAKRPLLEDCCDDIKQADSLDDVFCILKPYVSFLDCHVIKHIVGSLELCTNEDRKELNGYLVALDHFCQRNVFECPQTATNNHKHENLVMKVDEDIFKKFTIKAIKEFQAKVAEKLGLKSYTISLLSVGKGCLKLTFQIPRFVVEVIFPLSREEQEQLKALGILRLTCERWEYDLQSRSVQDHQPILSPYQRSSLGCVRFRLLGECRFGSQCRFGHSHGPIVDPPTEYIPIPQDISSALRRSLIGKVDFSPNRKPFITVESELSPSEEIKIVAEDSATMEFAKQMVFDESRVQLQHQELIQRECVKYKLLTCEKEDCKFIHGDVVESPSVGYVAHPVGRIPTLKKIVGLIGQSPKGSYIVVESDKDRNKEVKVYAENDEALEYAKKAVLVKFGQSHSDHWQSGVAACGIALCYVHPDGVEKHGLRLRLKSHEEKGRRQFTLQKEETKFGAQFHVKNYQGQNKQLPHNVYHMLDNPDETRGLEVSSSFTAQVRVLRDYREQIHEQLHDALRWMYDQRLHPKLEGRFGKIRWGKMPNFLVRESFDVHRFVNFLFKNPNYMRFFRPQLEKASVLQAVQDLADTGSMVETYDMKIAVENKGKLDIRLQFASGRTEILAVKKDEEKLLFCDILSMHRAHDVRLSLNNYQTSSELVEDPTVKQFASNVQNPKRDTLEFVAQDYNKEWTARMVRHKKRQAFHYGPNKNYVLTFSHINSYEIKANDLEPGAKHTIITIKPADWKEHYEIELHNLSWEVAFGHIFGYTPQKSLSLILEPDKIPPEILTSSPHQWNPDNIMADFVGDGFLQMLDDINERIVV